MTTYTIKLAVNGSETDPHDSASWLSKVSKVRVVGGGGTWFRPASPLVADFWLDVPAARAGAIRTATIAVEGPWNAGSPPNNGYTPSAGHAGRVIFHGEAQGAKGQIPAAPLQMTFLDEMSGLFNRKPFLAADLYDVDGPRDILGRIETGLSLTISGESAFPEGATDTGYWLTLQKTKKKTCGQVIQAALAGTGVNMVTEWSGDVTSPVMRWRPDFYYKPDGTSTINTTGEETITVYRPWLAVYSDFGLAYEDFVAKVIVNGIDSTEADIYGWAQLSSSTERSNLSHREVTLAGINSYSADAKAAAERLINRTGNPEYHRMVNVDWYPDVIHADYVADSVLDNTVEDALFNLAAVRLGDRLRALTPFNDLVGGGGTGDHLWPASAPYDDLEALWLVDVVNESTSHTTRTHLVRYTEREWTPKAGWRVTTGLWPQCTPGTSAAGNKGQGPY